MTLLTRVLGGLRALLTKRKVEQELDEELHAYLDAAIERKVATGMTRDDAVRAARAEMGSAAAIKDYTYDVGWESTIDTIWRDVRFAIRSFRRAPGFTAAAIVTLGLGIGGTTAIFSVVDTLFVRAPDGVADPSALRKVFLKRDTGTIQTGEGGPGSWVDYVTIRDHVPAFSRIGVHRWPEPADLGRGPGAERVSMSLVSHEFLDILGVRPAAGRFFLPEEDGALGAHPVAVISHAMWHTRFGGVRDAIGRTILLNGNLLEIVGVAPRDFIGIGADRVDVWVPSSVSDVNSMGSDWRTQPVMAGVHYVARLAPGATDALARGQAATALRHAAEAAPSLDQTPQITTTSLALAATPGGTTTGELSLWLVLVAVILLTVACANVANLLLARGLTRRRELAVRLSIGAGRWRVMQQQLTESLVLALCGGAAGVLFGYSAMGLMRQFPVPPSAGRIDERLLFFALSISLLTGLLFGVLPALRAVRVDPAQDLKDSRTTTLPGRHLTRAWLLALQVSLSLLLLVGAGLFVRSLGQVIDIDAGVDVDRLLVARVDLERAGASIDPQQFYDRAVSALLTVPGVERAALVHLEPLTFASLPIAWRIPGGPSTSDPNAPATLQNAVGPDYFRTAGTRLLRGREIDATDRAGEPVAVVNDRLARQMADDGDVVGRCVPFGRQLKTGGCTRIVGVVASQRQRYLEPERPPMVFRAWAQAPDAIPYWTPALLVRIDGDPERHVADVHRALQRLRSDLPYVSVEPLAENFRAVLLPFRLGATLFTMFAVLALVVAGVGLYGVLAYFVNERTAEIGIRRSLGAESPAIVGLIVRQAVIPVGAGLVTGTAVAFAGTRQLESLLFGIDARDPISFAAAATFLVLVALLATLVPAWRAGRVDPMVALRCD